MPELQDQYIGKEHGETCSIQEAKINSTGRPGQLLPPEWSGGVDAAAPLLAMPAKIAEDLRHLNSPWGLFTSPASRQGSNPAMLRDTVIFNGTAEGKSAAWA